MRRQSHILNAILLLIAGTLAIGGPIVVHHQAPHHPQAAHNLDAAHADHPGDHNRCLPAENPLPAHESSDCPDCDLLTTMTVADTAVAAVIVPNTAGWAPSLQPADQDRVQTDRAPRTTRGPPAA